MESSVRSSIQSSIGHQSGIIGRAEKEMIGPMERFLMEYRDEAKDLQAKSEYAADFARIHQRLAEEDLPQHKERFRDFLNANLTQNIAGLDAMLAEEVKAHRKRMEQVNTALRHLEYSGQTYVEVAVNDTRERTVAEFKADLRSILGAGMQPDEHARLELFTMIRKLVERFRKEPEWTRQVTDSRGWLGFGINERRRSDGASVDFLDSSQGKSGGQKAKLAFTLLAASLLAQYGLADDAGRADSFRLVVIDEIFARTDEPNSRRALQLFRDFGFQLILAAPWEAKVRIAESFVDSWHLTLNPAGDASTVQRASRAAYDAARDHALKLKPQPVSADGGQG